MRFVHLSDIHIGKNVNEFSMLLDQQFILNEILEELDHINPDAVLIAGDVYDKAVPSAEAVEVLDDFITRLAGKAVPVFIISGNHDSGERLSFGSRLMQSNRIYICGGYNGTLEKYVLTDSLGDVNVYLLPFIKPPAVRRFFQDKEISTYEQAVTAILEKEEIDSSSRNILVAHQFITGGADLPQRANSESVSVGGVDNIDVSLFHKFDYVALGHLHNPQRVGRDTVRYCGSPLKYSFSECRYNKSLTVVDIAEKNKVAVQLIPLEPRRDMREIRGNIDVLMSAEIVNSGNNEDYLHVTLTDEQDLFDPMGRLRTVYPNIMRLDIDNQRTQKDNAIDAVNEMEGKSNLQLFNEFYRLQNNHDINKDKCKIVMEILQGLGVE